MKFTDLIAELNKDKTVLRWSCLSLGLACVALTITAVCQAERPPVVVDRGCSSSIAALVPPNQHPESEIREFLSKALSERFDSDAGSDLTFLSDSERARRQKEQDELKLRGLTQTIIPRLDVIQADKKSQEGLSFVINADRLLAVGTVRSAFLFPIKVSLVSVPRGLGNPYGLILESVEADSSGSNAGEGGKS